MRIALLSLLLGALATLAAHSFEIEDETLFEVPNAQQRLSIISTADTNIFSPIIEDFQRGRPQIEIEYVTASSTELMRAIASEGEAFDLAISSAMDLNTKLSNDGMTMPHISDVTGQVPDWARWRNHVFAFTQEPATFVISPAAFSGLPVPETRQQLITLMRDHPDRFRGKVGTYDIRSSGLGYLFATQDARSSEIFWRLTEVMGSLDARLYCCSGDMIEDVASGRIAVAYNVLGSYARAREDLADRIEIIEPEDFTMVMLRSAVIPQTSQNPDVAGDFLDYLLDLSWSPDARPMAESPLFGPRQRQDRENAARRPIRLGPGLLVYLDALKRERFLREWQDAILQ